MLNFWLLESEWSFLAYMSIWELFLVIRTSLQILPDEEKNRGRKRNSTKSNAKEKKDLKMTREFLP